MTVGVRILPRKEILDTQGRAVERTLMQHGKAVGAVSVGRYVKLNFEGMDKEQALTKAKEVAEFVLYNPLIETYELEVL